MDKDYFIVLFQSILAQQMEEHAGEEKFDWLMEGVNENSVIEDMPFYKNYLSLFDVEQAFKGFNLSAEKKSLSRDDLYLLFRLVSASFSTTYIILYDKPSNTVDFSITVESDEKSITRNIVDLDSSQIKRLYKSYVNEQFDFSTGEFESDDLESIQARQKERLAAFERNVRELHEQRGKKRLFFDMDNVLVDFQSGLDKIDEEIKKQYRAKGPDDKDRLDEIPGLFGKMDPVPGAIEAVHKLVEVYDVFILSTAPWKNPSAWSDKVTWVTKYLDDVFHKRMIITHRKDLVEGDYLIDDRGKNGTSEFKGEWIHFGSERFPDWNAVLEYLLNNNKDK